MARIVSNRLTLFIASLAVLAVHGCQPPRGGGRSTAALPAVVFESPLDFGDQVQLDFAPGVPRSIAVQVPVENRPPRRPIGGQAVLDKRAVRLTKTVVEPSRQGVRLQSRGDRADVTFLAAPRGAVDVCERGEPVGSFGLVLNESGDDFTIEPPSVALRDDVIDLVLSGGLQMCVRVSATYQGRIEIDGLNLLLNVPAEPNPDPNPPGPIDRATARVIVDGVELDRFDYGDPEFFVFAAAVPFDGQSTFGGYVQIGFFHRTDVVENSWIAIAVEHSVELTGAPMPLTDVPALYQVVGVSGGDAFVGFHCNEFTGQNIPCGAFVDEDPLGTISLQHDAGRIRGSFDFTLTGFDGEAVRAVGELDLPVTDGLPEPPDGFIPGGGVPQVP